MCIVAPKASLFSECFLLWLLFCLYKMSLSILRIFFSLFLIVFWKKLKRGSLINNNNRINPRPIVVYCVYMLAGFCLIHLPRCRWSSSTYRLSCLFSKQRGRGEFWGFLMKYTNHAKQNNNTSHAIILILVWLSEHYMIKIPLNARQLIDKLRCECEKKHLAYLFLECQRYLESKSAREDVMKLMRLDGTKLNGLRIGSSLSSSHWIQGHCPTIYDRYFVISQVFSSFNACDVISKNTQKNHIIILLENIVKTNLRHKHENKANRKKHMLLNLPFDILYALWLVENCCLFRMSFWPTTDIDQWQLSKYDISRPYECDTKLFFCSA